MAKSKNTTAATTVSNLETPVVMSPLELAKKALADAKAAIKELKTTEVKVKKETKGVPISFQNQAGQTITGKGVLYYVVRHGGKLHYKAADAVTLLTAEEAAEIEALPA